MAHGLIRRASLRDRVAALLLGGRLTRGPAGALRARRHGNRPIRWGSLRRTEPICGDWGLSRGTPIDRAYIEGFLHEHAHLVRGDVLEMEQDRYASRLAPGARVHVLDLDPANPDATIVGDLCAPDTLPADAFDTVILTQTLLYLPDVPAALRNLYRALRPGGAMLITVPTMAPLDRGPLGDTSLWRWTANGLRHAIAGALPGATVETHGYGNVLACAAFLFGACQEDLTPSELARHDGRFPLVATAVVRRPAAS